jgi:Xaa-Pro aminopeptidase
MIKEQFLKRRRLFVETMENNSVFVLFAGSAPQRSADLNYNFTPDKHFVYFTGLDKPRGILLVHKLDGQTIERLFIERSTPYVEKWEGKRMSPEQASTISGIKVVDYVDEFTNFLTMLLHDNDIQTAYLDLDKLKWDAAATEAHNFSQQVNAKFPYMRIINVHYQINEMTNIKSPEEIDCIRASIEMTRKGILSVMSIVKPGMMEYELEAQYQYTLRSAGVRPNHNCIIGTGKYGTVLHRTDNNSRIEDGDLVLFDCGAQVEYYNSDITRTFPANGRFSPRQKEIYNIVLRAQKAAIDFIRPGLINAQVNEVVITVYKEELKKIGLIQTDADIEKYYYHRVSHMLGLDTHEGTDRSKPYKPGMVVTMEPGLYIAEEGIGIRIEDDVLITETGCTNLSAGMIKTVEEIEAFMQNR